MKKKRAIILCTVALLCIGLFLGQELLNNRNTQMIVVSSVDTVMGIEIIDDQDFLKGKEKRIPSENTWVTFENMLLPYDEESNTLYLSQSLKGWVGTLSAADERSYVLCAPADDYWRKEQQSVKEGHVFTLWAVSKEHYYEFQLVISGMPVISMTTERIEEQEEIPYEVDPDKKFFGSETLHYGTISVFNPDVGVDRYELLQSNLCYHLKGASTKGFEKKSFSLELQDHRNKSIDVALLGMRADSDWKLNALNTDTSRVREITASQIWEQIDEADTKVHEPGPRMEYVELILDGKYNGLYCLVEPVDVKKLALDENDVLYKIIDWGVPESTDIQQSIDMGWKIQYPIRIRYPKEISDYHTVWHPIRDYLDTFYRGYEIDYEESAAKVDIHNLTDYFIFTMTASTSDNTYKNIYYAAHVEEDGSYRMMIYPWDLDYSFGNTYSYGAVNNTAFNEDYTAAYSEDVFMELKNSNPKEIGALLLEKWNRYRGSFLSTDRIIQLFKDNQTYMMETGALMREAGRWQESGVTIDIEQLIDYQTKRMLWFDEYFVEWVKE